MSDHSLSLINLMLWHSVWW